MMALFAGSLGRYAMYAALAVAVAGGAAWVIHEHDNRVRAEQQLAIDKANAAAIEADHARAIAALEQAATEARDRADNLERLKARVHAQPVTTACVQSPAVRAALDGLRQHGGSPGATSAGAGKPAILSR